jgi:hypothetical protein
MKLFFAAPESFLPSALTAFGSHASRLHFFRKLLSAAPARGLPFLSTALVAHVSCAIAGQSAKAAIIPARRIRFMDFLLLVNLPFIAKIADPSAAQQCGYMFDDLGGGPSREYLTEREVERLMKAAGDNRHGHRGATMILMAFQAGILALIGIEFELRSRRHPEGASEHSEQPDAITYCGVLL